MARTTRRDGRWPPLSMTGIEVDEDSDEEIDEKPPVHPVPTMQGAFEESMAESLNESNEPDPSDRYSTADSVSRRKMLLEQAEYERTVAGRWKQKPGEKFHPLWKLVAQISFGMHLLQQRQAKSDEEVIRILQTHVDDVDGFLERTTEDFDLAQGDINERIRYLRLPLEHGEVFDGMLNDRSFRIAIVEGNEKIEHIIDRTAVAMTDALKDVQKGLDATRELAKYLTRVDKRWDDRTEEHDSVYLAMIGNTEGWTRAFLSLQTKGNTLRKALFRLGGIVAEMQKRAGAASRKNLVPVRSVNGRYQVEVQAPAVRHSLNTPKSPNKPLPEAPEKTIPRSSKTHRSSHSGAGSSIQGSKPPALRTKASSSSSHAEQAVTVKRVEPVRRVMSSELKKPMKSSGSTVSREPSEAALRVKSGSSVPPTPTSSSSRRESLSERTRSMTRKFSFFKDAKDDKQQHSETTTQAAQVHEMTGDFPLSSSTRRSSSRKANTASASAYSASPTSLKKAPESPTKWEANVQTTSKKAPESPIKWEANLQTTSKSQEHVPSQSAYGKTDFLPAQPALSPLLTDKSFGFGEEFRFPTHSRSSSHQTAMPSINRHEAEHMNKVSSLSQEVYPTVDTNKSSHEPLRSTQVIVAATAEMPSDSIGAYPDIGSNAGNSSRGLKSTKNDSENLNDSHQPLKSPILISEGTETPTVSQSTSPPGNPQVVPGPTSPVMTELEAPLPPSHPLLQEPRHQKSFTSKTRPPSPDTPPVRDLPLRHYRSHEQMPTAGVMLTREGPSIVADSFAPQAPTMQPLPDIKAGHGESSLKAASSPAVPQFSVRSSSIRPVAVLGSESPAANDASQRSNSSGGMPPVHESVSDSKESSKSPSSLQAESSGVGAMSTTNTAVVSTKTDHLEASKSSPSQLSPGLSSPDLSFSMNYKTSATHNAPFFLSPNSSAALIDFLAATPPSTPPEPQAQSQSDKISDAPMTSQQNQNLGHNLEPAAADPSSSDVHGTVIAPKLPQSTHGLSSTSPPTLDPPPPSTIVPPSTSAPPSAGVEKTSKWKKMFGVRGASKQKNLKPEPEVVIVGKGEWYKIDRKKKQKGQSSTPAGGQDVNGYIRPTNHKPTTPIGTGIMGTGKDAVWISGKNFVKS